EPRAPRNVAQSRGAGTPLSAPRDRSLTLPTFLSRFSSFPTKSSLELCRAGFPLQRPACRLKWSCVCTVSHSTSGGLPPQGGRMSIAALDKGDTAWVLICSAFVL